MKDALLADLLQWYKYGRESGDTSRKVAVFGPEHTRRHRTAAYHPYNDDGRCVVCGWNVFPDYPPHYEPMAYWSEREAIRRGFRLCRS